MPDPLLTNARSTELRALADALEQPGRMVLGHAALPEQLMHLAHDMERRGDLTTAGVSLLMQAAARLERLNPFGAVGHLKATPGELVIGDVLGVWGLPPEDLEQHPDGHVFVGSCMSRTVAAALLNLDPDTMEPWDEEALLEAAWRRETGSNDPQGPPPGWRPRHRRCEP